MSDQGMRNLEQIHVAKIKRRIQEIGERFLWADARDVAQVAAAETLEHVLADAARRLPFKPVRGGFEWGRPWSTAWFRLRLAVPREWRGETVALRFRTGGECIVFRAGEPLQALDHGRDLCVFPDAFRGGERFELFVEAGASGAFGQFERRRMEQPRLVVLNAAVWEAYWDLAALADIVDPPERRNERLRFTGGLSEGDTFRARLIHTLDRAVDLFDYGRPSREALATQARHVRRSLKPLYDCPAAASAQTIACMGHSHIDVAWLWPLAETVRKCGRTFSNVLGLMERYPEFKFVQSQPHLYEFAKHRYPGLYRRLRAQVKRGQWVPDGAMWVEADCNVTSGESLVRQVLFGTRFFRAEFGVECSCLWLPDVFGYSAALPQILKRSGIDNFLTQKISWNQFTRFPHHSFWWEGIDGSRVLSHFPPADTYNAFLGGQEVLNAAREYKQKGCSAVQAIPFGFGDGGGGPTREMLERMRRYRNLEGMPKLAPMTPREFFRRLAAEGRDLPLWVGELYFEMHRGTYTTQAYNKRNNRKSELLLREAEILSAFGMADGAPYDQKRLNALWKLVLLNQFHDIIPGSSIDEVYRDSDKHYAEILGTAAGIRDGALARLAAGADTRGEGQAVVAFNSLSWDRSDVVAVPGVGGRRAAATAAVAADGQICPVQVGADGVARFIARLPSMGYRVFHLRPGRAQPGERVAADERTLENGRVRVEFDALGRVRRLFDKEARREALASGAVGNQFMLFEDKMISCGEAWDLEIFFNDKPLEFDGKLLSVEVREQGPVRGVVRFTRAISRSRITQDVVLHAGSPRVDFVTRVDWGDEKDVLLKVAFPMHVRSDTARYEIQFGNVARPTHWNRPQDMAMFEVAGQKWADLSESDYGVALLNDGKYGHDTHGNVMRLSLLRAPKNPGKTADVGKPHDVTYSVLPHAGGYTNGVVRAAYELNVPLSALAAASRAGRKPAALSRMSISGDNVIVDTVKKAEDDASVIVRLYEAHGCRGRRRFATALPVRRVVETDLMERPERTLAMRDGRVDLDFKPFQIRTLKLIFDKRGRQLHRRIRSARVRT